MAYIDSPDKLAYLDQRALVHAWKASGRGCYVRTQRGGSLAISLSGHRAVCVHDAMMRIEACMEREPSMRAAFFAYPGR